MGFEPLEDRILLSGLSNGQISAINSGLSAFETWVGNLAQSATLGDIENLLARQLPVVSRSINELIDLSAKIHEGLVQPIADYLGSGTPTTDGLENVVYPGHTASSSTANGVTTWTFAVPSFTATATSTSVPLDLGMNAASQNITIPGTAPQVEVTPILEMNFSFHVDSNNNFFFTFEAFAVTVSVNATNLSFPLDFGVLGGMVSNGSLDLTAGVTVDFDDPSNVTTSRLTSSANDAGSIASITPTNNSGITAALPFSASLSGIALTSKSAALVLSDGDPFDGLDPTIQPQNFGTLNGFSTITPFAMLDQISQLSDWFDQVRRSVLFATPIAFTGLTAGSVLDFGTAFQLNLVAGLVNVLAPTAAPGVAPGSGSGGALAAGTYTLEYTFAHGDMESVPSPTSATFTVAAGSIPVVNLPPIPRGYTVNVYLSNNQGDSESLTLYRSGVTSSTVQLDLAAGNGTSVPEGTRQAPGFATVQELASLLSTALTTGDTPFEVNPTWDPQHADLTFVVSFIQILPRLETLLNLGLNLGSFNGMISGAGVQITPTLSAGVTLGFDLRAAAATLVGSAPAPAVLSGSALTQLPGDGRLGGEAVFALAIGNHSPVTVTIPEAATSSLTSIFNSNDPDDATTLVGQINRALQNASFASGDLGQYVVAGFQYGQLTLTLRKYDLGTSLEIDIPSSDDPMITVLGFGDGDEASLATLAGSPSFPVPTDGRLGADSAFTLVIGSHE